VARCEASASPRRTVKEFLARRIRSFFSRVLKDTVGTPIRPAGFLKSLFDSYDLDTSVSCLVMETRRGGGKYSAPLGPTIKDFRKHTGGCTNQKNPKKASTTKSSAGENFTAKAQVVPQTLKPGATEGRGQRVFYRLVRVRKGCFEPTTQRFCTLTALQSLPILFEMARR
jgi:hypothetical protein